MKPVFVIMLLLTVTTGFSQNGIVANRRSQPLYVGLENELIVALDGFTAKDLDVTVNIGKVVKDKGRFIYYADSAGVATFMLYKLVKAERIPVASFAHPVHVVFPPGVDLSIGGKREGKIHKSELEVQDGVSAYYDWSEWGIACLEGVKPVLKSYRLIIMQQDQLLFTGQIAGPGFPEEVKAVFKTLAHGDKLYLVDVSVATSSGEKCFAKPFALEVITSSTTTKPAGY